MRTNNSGFIVQLGVHIYAETRQEKLRVAGCEVLLLRGAPGTLFKTFGLATNFNSVRHTNNNFILIRLVDPAPRPQQYQDSQVAQ